MSVRCNPGDGRCASVGYLMENLFSDGVWGLKAFLYVRQPSNILALGQCRLSCSQSLPDDTSKPLIRITAVVLQWL